MAEQKSPPTPEWPKVFRNTLTAHRGDYFAEYHPAQLPYCAMLNLTFPKKANDHGFVRASMENELKYWLLRYAVPVMVHGIDEKEDLIHFTSGFEASTLMGYSSPDSNQLVIRWGLFHDAELPHSQLQKDYLSSVYHDVPFRLASETREKAIREQRYRVRCAKVIVFFIVLVPVLIEIVAMGVGWLGHLLAAVSIITGLYKAAKAFGWIKQSNHEKAKAEEELKIRHHHYHCEKNPRSFERLRAENFAREAEERVKRDNLALQEGPVAPAPGKT